MIKVDRRQYLQLIKLEKLKQKGKKLNKKLESSLKKFETELEVQPNASVFDFLYVDHNRIASFLSQFNDFGGLTSIVRGRSAQRGKRTDYSVKTEGSAFIVKGSSDYTKSTSAGYSEEDQKTYDPLWINVLNFLDQIEERGLLNRNIEESGFGELVLIKGPLRITDYSTLEKTWSIPALREAAEAGLPNEREVSRHERRRHGKGNPSPKPNNSPLDLFFQLVVGLPHTVQLRIGDAPTAWGVLAPDGLVSASSDFVLKFGSAIPGEWVAIGIMDAIPDTVTNPSVAFAVADLDQVAPVMLSHLEPIIRQLLGRPPQAYGITPLAVFREVSARPK
jgi:hypothetical protein